MSQILPSISGPLFDQDLMVRVTLVLLHFLWQGSLCGLAALLAGRLMPNASSSARYRVFVGILCLMAVLPAVTYWRTKGGREDSFAPAAARPPVDSLAAAASPPATVRRAEAAAPVRAKPISEKSWAPSASQEAVFLPQLSEPSVTAVPSVLRIDAAARFVVGAYFIGVLAMFARLLVALWGGRRLRCSAVPIEEGPLAEIVLRQAQRIGLKAIPLIAWCARTSVPVVVGILRPMILLPATLATGFDPVLLEALVAHELAHLRRYDPLVNLAQRLIEAVLFFHPAVWYVSRRVSAERENACDDLVLLAGWPRVQYADALLQMAERSAAAQGIPSQAAAGAVLAASGRGSSQLGRRVLRLLEIGDSPRVRLSRGGVFLLATAALLVVASSPFIHAVTNKKQGASAAQQAAPPPTAAQSATLTRIFAAWQKRQAQVKSFHVVWNTRVTLPKGFEFRSYGHISTPAELWVRNVPIVQNHTEFTMPQTEWWGQGDEHFRFDFPIVENEGANRWSQVAHVRLIRDGSIRSRLTFPSSPASKPWLTIWSTVPVKGSLPTAFAEPLRSGWRNGEGDLIPMGLALRPLSPASEWTPQNCRIESGDYVVGNVHCIKITKYTGDRAETRWVDPKRDDVVIQQATFDSHLMVIEYQRDPQHGWIPSHWTWTIPSANWLPRDTKTSLPGPAIFQATVTRCAINEKFDADPFAATEPPGTQIYDVTADSSIHFSVEEHSPLHHKTPEQFLIDSPRTG
jgi:beta-lactamase regulating signal transducer with metallopeptidase domain